MVSEWKNSVRKRGENMKKIKCLNCNYPQAIEENDIFEDELGKFTACENCNSSFDIE